MEDEVQFTRTQYSHEFRKNWLCFLKKVDFVHAEKQISLSNKTIIGFMRIG